MDDIRERMCNNYCGFGVKFGAGKDIACKHCPLNELPKWVPVVEDTPRLTNKKRAMSYSDKVLICLENGYIDVGYFRFTDRFEWCNEISCRYCKEVIAWMSLPEPYVEPTDEPSASELQCAEEHRQLAEWLKDYKRLKEQEPKSPCDVCRYNPPGSGDGKPCTMCPADATERFKNKLESGYFRKRREV